MKPKPTKNRYFIDIGRWGDHPHELKFNIWVNPTQSDWGYHCYRISAEQAMELENLRDEIEDLKMELQKKLFNIQSEMEQDNQVDEENFDKENYF